MGNTPAKRRKRRACMNLETYECAANEHDFLSYILFHRDKKVLNAEYFFKETTHKPCKDFLDYCTYNFPTHI